MKNTDMSIKHLEHRTTWLSLRAGGQGFPPATMNVVPGSRLLSLENGRKTEPKEIPGCLISRPLVVFTRQLKILVTTLKEVSPKFDNTIIISLKYGT